MTGIRKLFPVLPLLVFSCGAKAQAANPRTALLDVQHYRFSITLNDSSNLVRGEATVTIRFLKDSSGFSIDLVGKTMGEKGMTVRSVKEQDKLLPFRQSAKALYIPADVSAGTERSFTISYDGIPADGLIISTGKYGRRSFFADNWPNRAHYWIPCVDHPSDKASVEFLVTAPEHYQVVSNGIKIEETNLPGNTRLSHWKTTIALPTKVMVIGAADFSVGYEGNVGCIPVTAWVYPEDRDKGFYDYRLATGILSYFIRQVGPFAYEKLANVQSKTSFGGMENASAIFYGENTIKGNQRNEALLAHEIAHQWFGDAVTEANWQHLWLSEGFATYMTHCYIESKYGADSLQKRLREDRNAIIAFAKKKNTPVVDTTVNDDFMQLLSPNSYQKGGWVLHMLRRKLGDSLFWMGLRLYYAGYNGANAGTDDFRKLMERVSGTDLKGFFRQWLYVAGQPRLHITWRFRPKEKDVLVTILQQTPALFSFPLLLALQTAHGSRSHYITVSGRSTIVTIPVNSAPAALVPDPDTDLLFEANVTRLQ